MSRNWKSSEALLLDDDYTWTGQELSMTSSFETIPSLGL